MVGLVPAIHAAPLRVVFAFEAGGLAWMPGTRPGMTAVVYEGSCKSDDIELDQRRRAAAS